VKQEYFRHNVQADDRALKVPLKQLTDAAGPPSIATSLADWRYDANHNAVTRGYVFIETAGEYEFKQSSSFARGALYLGSMDEPFLPSNGTKRMEFPAGLIPIAAVGYLKSNSGSVSWMPPGAKEFVPIPGKLFFHREK
jgi:hypothetical protein